MRGPVQFAITARSRAHARRASIASFRMTDSGRVARSSSAAGRRFRFWRWTAKVSLRSAAVGRSTKKISSKPAEEATEDALGEAGVRVARRGVAERLLELADHQDAGGHLLGRAEDLLENSKSVCAPDYFASLSDIQTPTSCSEDSAWKFARLLTP